MNDLWTLRFALERHEQLLREAEVARALCCAPKKIKVNLPRVTADTRTPCPTC